MEIGPGGSATRTVEVISQDEGEPAEHPRDLLGPSEGYALLRDVPGVRRVQAHLADVDDAPSGFGFRSHGAAAAASRIRFATVDWVLFEQYRYAETVRDVVDSDEVKAVLDEASLETARLLEATLRGLFGEAFDDTVLRKRLRTDLREMFREAAFMTWQELSRNDPAEGDAAARVLPRLVRLARRYGIEAEWSAVEAWLDSGEPLDRHPEVARPLVLWLEAGLAPVEEDGRVLLVSNVEAILFSGFQSELEKAFVARFGDLDEAEAWAEGLWNRAFGAFGPNREDVVFHLRVKLPGELLRSNGYLSGGGWSFVEFAAGEAYPAGAGIDCESVLWDPQAVGTLPRTGLAQDNETALSWTRVLGEGPASRPDAVLTELLETCLRQRSLAALEEHLEEEGLEPRRAEQARALLAWLEGERD